MKPLIIFGIGKIAEVVHYVATLECEYEVVGFCVDAQYCSVTEFLGKPVVDFAIVQTKYQPQFYDMFIAVGYHDMNELRQEKCKEAIDKGYTLVSIISPLSNLPKNTTIGQNCFIMNPCIIHPCVTLGNNVFVWSGALIGHHSIIGDNCWLTSNSNVGGNVVLGTNNFLALNTTISNSIIIGNSCFLGANTLITKNLNSESVLIVESSKPIKLNSKQFLKISRFSSL